jgi:hypothetical protein
MRSPVKILEDDVVADVGDVGKEAVTDAVVVVEVEELE